MRPLIDATLYIKHPRVSTWPTYIDTRMYIYTSKNMHSILGIIRLIRTPAITATFFLVFFKNRKGLNKKNEAYIKKI